MDLANVPTYSVTRLEKLAAECLAEKLSAVSPPIDVEYLLETEPGVLLDILPGLESRFGVNGVVYRRGPAFSKASHTIEDVRLTSGAIIALSDHAGEDRAWRSGVYHRRWRDL